jgi:uncharacterized protein (DUF58 family)
VGLLLYTDCVEQYLPPKKGRRHVLRVVREILYHEPRSTGTESVKALEIASHLLHRRAIVFLISDFQSNGDPDGARIALRRAARQCNRRHDMVAVHIEDPREREIPDLGVVSLEDAETGELVELDTGDPTIRDTFHERSTQRAKALVSDLRGEGVDTLELLTDAPYLPALQRFFKNRKRRHA